MGGPGGISILQATAAWQANVQPIDSLKGTHVDMVVDPDNNVHIAYYDTSSGGLWYTLIPPTGTGYNMRPNVSGKSTVRVDTYLGAGTKIMINVRRNGTSGPYVPYISYAQSSFGETKNSVRVAWRKTFNSGTGTAQIIPVTAGSDGNDRLTGAWEVMSVPSFNVPEVKAFISNGVPTDYATGWAEPNTTGTDNVTNAPMLSRSGVNLNTSIVLGYMTNSYYEGAILKANVTTTPTP